MKNSPKNFYNVVDKKKLGIDDIAAVTGDVAELKSDVSQLETVVEDPATGLVKTVADLKEAVDNIDYDISRKADIDGTYPDLTAGHAQNAEQLDSTVLVEDKEPYIFRTSGGSKDIGNRENDQLVGGSIVWNQLVDTSTSTVTIPSGLKTLTFINGDWDIIESDGNAIAVTGGTDMVFNLTQMFGSSVADQINTLEQAQSGSGIALFRKMFPKAYYAYNAGQLMSVKATAHEMVGFNAYDHVTGTAKLLGGNEYQITGTYTAIAYEDINGDAETITPNASGIFTPTNNGIMTVTGGNDTDTCIHLTWTGYRNGEFEPYIKRSYSLDDDLELRGIPKVDVNGNIYYDGDTYESDGTVTRKYEIVDLGTLTWNYSASTAGTNVFISGVISTIKAHSNFSFIPNMICYKYITKSWNDLNQGENATNGITVYNNKTIRIVDSAYTDAVSFKTAMSGVYLVYEVATPTTESADPYADPQYVDDFGTEEYVDTRAIPVPVGHITQYPANLRDKLQHLPSPTGVDGDYIIREDTQSMTLVPAPTGVPELPSVDGAYVLTCTVSDGSATLTWTSNS